MKRYNPKDIEARWQRIWDETKLYEVTENPAKAEDKAYVIDMFPYPSGAGLHVGHVRNFSISDTYAQYLRQRGKNVLRTIGFDAFGLPTENYAIKTGISPQEATASNVKSFSNQLRRIGMSYDWSRQVLTTDPEYYRWTQWIFLQLFKHGLAYQKENPQWWCEHDQTVLADEQVVNGRCWRCERPVVKKALKQWFFKITDYADKLLEGLDNLDWPEKIKLQQRNWIGRSVGAAIRFEVKDKHGLDIEVFTTRPETLFGATFMVLAPEHPLVAQITTDDHKAAVNSYVSAAQAKSEIERMETDRKKTGVFTGAHVVNSATGEDMPVWIADYVLAGYGTGAIMAVPAHDERDYEFAASQSLPIRNVIEPVTGVPQLNPEYRESIVAIVEDPDTKSVLTINWGKSGGNLFVGGGRHKGESFKDAAIREVAEETGYDDLELISQTEPIHHHYYAHSKQVARKIKAVGFHFRLRSQRQSSIRLESDEQGQFSIEWLPVGDAERLVKDQLHQRVLAACIQKQVYTGEGIMANSGQYDGMSSPEAREAMIKQYGREQVTYRMRDWLISRQRYWGAPIPVIHCAKCGTVPVPEDQLPVELPVLKSYAPSGDGRSALASAPEWLNVPCPDCGGDAERETDTMDGYACSSWYFLRYADAQNRERAFDRKKVDYWMPVDVYVGGDHAVAHLLYARFWTMFMKEQGLVGVTEPFKGLRYNGYILAPDNAKMSKSKGNVVDPLDLIDQGYGADALRLYELFIGPYEQSVAWNPTGIDGTKRFLNRVWSLVQDHLEARSQNTSVPGAATLETALAAATHRMIRKTTVDLEKFAFNTAIAAMMEGVNELYRLKTQLPLGTAAWQDNLKLLVQVLAPFAPHVTEELWQDLGGKQSVHISAWPAFDANLIQQEMQTVVVQVNGKLRGQIEVPVGAAQEDVERQAASQDNVADYLKGGQVIKTVYVPGKIVNFVVKL